MIAPPTREVIEDCLLRYTRGIDRLDADLVTSAFHPEAELVGYGRHGTMTIEAFVDRALPSLREGYRATQHRLSNITLGEPASGGLVVESYVLAFHVRDNPDDGDGPDQLLTFNGRYVDRFVTKDDQWRVAHRRLRVDWTRIEMIEATMPGEYITGTRDRSDASYA